MKTTITEEYEDGQLVRRTTVTDGEPVTGGYVWPKPDLICTCGAWMGVVPPPPCPAHGQAIRPTIMINATAMTSPKVLAAKIGHELRRIA